MFVCVTAMPVSAQETFTGRLSDSACGASHQSKAAAGSLSDRACVFACINGLAKYVLVDEHHQVIPIANQDAMGLPLYAGRPVRITGERKGDAIVVTRVEAIPAHLHIGHVMTNWRDTPGGRGFLPVAIDEARVALLHARLAAKSLGLDEMKLHAGHVLHGLDPAVEPTGPGAGYGVRKAATGALQHLEFAAKAEGATPAIATHAATVSSSLSSALQSVDQAVATAMRIRAATDAADAARSTADLLAQTARMSDEQLLTAKAAMDLMLKAEGLVGAPR